MTLNKKQKSIINGILLLDKPLGLSSNQALQRVKKLFNAKKAGHGGSLDPLATGLLPICFGKATRVTNFLLNATKSYEVTVDMGLKTTTGDLEGEAVGKRQAITFSATELEAAMKQFVGDIMQIPPMYSALKHHGKPLYKLARTGEVIDRKAREVTIHKFKLTGGDLLHPKFFIKCSKGTYIRTLVEDLGEKLGCGAHTIQLRRVEIGPYKQYDMVTMDTLEGIALNESSQLTRNLLSVDSVLETLPKVTIDNVGFVNFIRGNVVADKHISMLDTILRNNELDITVRVYNDEGLFAGIGQFDQSANFLHTKKVFFDELAH